jgi:hypothetical protein
MSTVALPNLQPGDDEDYFDAKEVYPSQSLFQVLSCEKICLFPGTIKRRLGEGIVDFVDCLPWLGNCGVLIFCELNRNLPEIRQHVEHQLCTEHEGIKAVGRYSVETPIPEIPATEPQKSDRDLLFPRCAESPPDWLPDYAKPPMDRFWGLWSVLEIEIPGREQKTLHLLHLGIGGQAVWLHFLTPHALKVTRIIVEPRDNHPGHLIGR